MIIPMTIIEFLSFAVRPFSLSIRLFANMLAGHILLQVFAGMVISLLAAGWLAEAERVASDCQHCYTPVSNFSSHSSRLIFMPFLASVYLRDAIEMH